MIYFSETQSTALICRYSVVGYRRFSNYWWASIIFLGGSGFFLTGISSYLKSDYMPFINGKNLLFFPQGLVMCFYGILGLFLSSYLWLSLFWDVGGGFNEFNKKEGYARLFRWGFPGKNRRISLSYDIKAIEAISLEMKEGFNPRCQVYIRVKVHTVLQDSETIKNNDTVTNSSTNNKEQILQNKRDIPLNGIGQLTTFFLTEKKAADLARFLQVPLELK